MVDPGLSDKLLLSFFGSLGAPELLLVAFIVLMLFGTRLPSVMRSLGIGVTEFKKGLKGEGVTDPDATIEDKRRDDL